MIERLSQSEDETRAIAQRLAERLRPGDVIALDGPLGVGKTCFVRGLAEGLGIDSSAVSSPTFILCQEYESAGGHRPVTLAHLDGYRLSSPDELETIGFDEMIEAGEVIIALEWADRFGDALPEMRIDVRLRHAGEHERRLRISAPGPLADRLASLVDADVDGASATGRCPICEKPVSRDAVTFPFCSRRCRMVDLGKWLGGEYRVTRPIAREDELF
jgi:tRNA threonylcarbamoyladenosine biosynthesis protein TsaE